MQVIRSLFAERHAPPVTAEIVMPDEVKPPVLAGDGSAVPVILAGNGSGAPASVQPAPSKGFVAQVLVLTVVLIALVVVALWWSYNVKRQTESVFVGAFFAIGVTSFLGFVHIARAWRKPNQELADGDLRLAIAAAFVSVFFGMLAFSLFSPSYQPSGFANTLTDSFLSQTSTIVAFYFASTAAIEIAEKWRAGGGKDSARHKELSP